MRWIGVAAAVFALAVAGAGCGGSSDSSSEAGTDTALTESSSTETTGVDTETSTEQETSTEVDTDLSGLSGECKDMAEASQKLGEAFANSAGGANDDLDATAAAFQSFADAAPDELKDDFEVLANAMTGYAEALRGLDLQAGKVPSAEQIAKLTKLGQSLNAAEVQQASTVIAAWGQENCAP